MLCADLLRRSFLQAPGGSPQADLVLGALVEARRQDRSAALVVDGSLGGGAASRRRIRALYADLVLLNRHEVRALLPAASCPPGRRDTAGTPELAALAQEIEAVVVVKGDPDRITDGVRAWQVPAGHPGLARHGTGDVLSGVAAGLLAQTLPAADAAALACHLVGTAGTALAADVGPGWLSQDLLGAVAAALRDLLTTPGGPNRGA
ncbi:NAD(P)H-hydrate dehydratase [Streptomyces demainii]|uniref:NAD(P)H-hydrate repair Nnr-like enzyme with NAD(P)H-hydrate dehydratase domain n=1 Tax=Streptomyces demainii TaxID=588122 RepID=A0ABT9KK52_9ACTN|nr:NAD(P)H-hydrate dehydratase [Streptomyces demainii]MDP9607927.1 NAD(P)H-hydrate repair Nnr-like enzyme with NAD(P)H-hydrate dehydratase domain [Streptomyces demainii]